MTSKLHMWRRAILAASLDWRARGATEALGGFGEYTFHMCHVVAIKSDTARVIVGGSTSHSFTLQKSTLVCHLPLYGSGLHWLCSLQILH